MVKTIIYVAFYQIDPVISSLVMLIRYLHDNLGHKCVTEKGGVQKNPKFT